MPCRPQRSIVCAMSVRHRWTSLIPRKRHKSAALKRYHQATSALAEPSGRSCAKQEVRGLWAKCNRKRPLTSLSAAAFPPSKTATPPNPSAQAPPPVVSASANPLWLPSYSTATATRRSEKTSAGDLPAMSPNKPQASSKPLTKLTWDDKMQTQAGPSKLALPTNPSPPPAPAKTRSSNNRPICKTKTWLFDLVNLMSATNSRPRSQTTKTPNNAPCRTRSSRSRPVLQTTKTPSSAS